MNTVAVFFNTFWPHMLTIFIGFIISFVEIANRFNSDLKTIFTSISSVVYILFNSILCLLCLHFVTKYNLLSGFFANDDMLAISLFTGFSSMMILRSSLFNIKINNYEGSKQIGFNDFINTILTYLERSFDRKNSRMKIKRVSKLVRKVKEIEKKIPDITTLCLNSMKALSENDQDILANEIQDTIENPNLSQEGKAMVLGVRLEEITGIPLLKEILNAIKRSKITSRSYEISELQEQLNLVYDQIRDGA